MTPAMSEVTPMPLVAAIVASYLLGSIPAAFIAGRVKGIDLRKHGSGNLGATNVIRVLGAKIGMAVFAFDMAKGAVPVLIALHMLPPTAWPWGSATIAAIMCGVAAIIGHVRPIYLKFGKGGKGVATAAGVFIALAPLQTLLALVVFAVVLLTSGFVSLGSLTSALMLPILLAITVGVRSPIFAMSALVGVFVFWTHRANITRLRNGEEHRFGKRRLSAAWTASLAIGLAIVLAIFIATRVV